MEAVNIDDARTRLPQLVDKAAAGENVIVSPSSKPLVRITQLTAPKHTVQLDLHKGRAKLAAAFNTPNCPPIGWLVLKSLR